MDNLFWVFFHMIMALALLTIWVFTEIVKGGKDIGESLKHSEEKSERSIGETILFTIILCAVFLSGIWLLINVVLKNSTVATWFVGICGIIFVYITIKQMIKMIFIPENRAFSISDIKDFTFTYILWWTMVVVVCSSQQVVDKLIEVLLANKDIVSVGMLLLWFYCRFLFAMGGMYILLYYLWIIENGLAKRLGFVGEKIMKLSDKIGNLWQRGEKYTGLKICNLWQKKGIINKLLLTMPFLVIDIWCVAYLLANILIRMTISVVTISIIGSITGLYNCISKLWNSYNNNVWMHVIAQIAGLCSYGIVFLIIQYDEYEEVIRKVYEFAGTVILIPYFLCKIDNVKKYRDLNHITHQNVNKSHFNVDSQYN